MLKRSNYSLERWIFNYARTLAELAVQSPAASSEALLEAGPVLGVQSALQVLRESREG